MSGTILSVRSIKFLFASMLACALVFSFALTRVDAAANDASIGLKKDTVSGLFTFTIRDPDGVQEFSLSLVGDFPYGGGLSGCPRAFNNNNVRFLDPDHFTPVMPAYVIDCNNNKTELEILPPVNGTTKSTVVKQEAPPPPPPKEEKAEEPLSGDAISYPVPALGSCQSEAECRSYCDNADHAKECLAFAKKHHLISEEDAEHAADKFLNVQNGPGGCDSWSSCETYCNTVEHLDECIAFADTTGYYSPAQLAEAKKFQELVKTGKQFPGDCKDRNTCELYCSVADHMEECLAFAEESGLMPKEEIEEARKFMTLMQKGESPGGCASKEQCERYCAEESHTEECIVFAQKAGVISDEDAAMARKVGGKGPGGCRSKQQCEAYCQNNSDECFRFAQEHGLIDEDQLKEMREGMTRFRDELDKMPPEAVQCTKDAAGEENFNKMLAGEPVFDRSLESKMKSCFGQITSQIGQQLNTLPPEAAQCIKDVVGEEGLAKLQSGEFDQRVNFSDLEVCFRELQASFGGGHGGPGGPGEQGGFAGPGGCKSIDACTAYCQNNPEACQSFAPPGGGIGDQPPPPPPISSCVPPPSGLVGWWSADLASGMSVPDIIGRSSGTISGGVIIVPMEVGGAFGFDGSSGRISIGNQAHLNFGAGPFSLEAWFNWDGGGGTSANNIIRKSNYPGSGPGSGYWLRVGAGALEFSVGATTGPEGQSFVTAPVRAGVWQHAVAVRDDSGAVKLYMDGREQGTVVRQAADANSTSETPFTIGAWDDRFGVTEFFHGQVDEIAVYSRALGASEVRDLFEAGSIGKCATDYGRTNRELPQDYPQYPPPASSQPSQPPTTFIGPGGCKTPEECTFYCTAHYMDPACQQFMPSSAPSSSLPLSLLVSTVLGPLIELLK